ncbi:MAG: DUF1599 domain-containing protein [Bacteroidota bacterium]
MNNTFQQFDAVIKICKDIFSKKMLDYSSSWRVMRNSSIVDQIFIKAQRIRTIDDKGTQKVEEDIRLDYISIVNYSIIGLIQSELSNDKRTDIPLDEASIMFDKFSVQAKSLMEKKNHDYGEAWRDMRISSFTDLILMKLFRIRQIEDNKGCTIISEGIDSNYYDTINYAIFALIKIDEAKMKMTSHKN